MGRIFIFNILRFLALVAAQVILFKNIGYYNLATPFPYILIILLLPFGLSNLLLYFLAFLVGLTLDAFYDSIGVHAAACVALAWFRISFFSVTLEIEAKESFNTPNWNNTDLKWYSSYVVLGTIIHHSVLYTVEVFSFYNVLQTIASVLLSTVFTLIVIFVISIITFKRKSRLAS